MKKRKLVLVTTNTSQVSSAAKESLVERPEQIDWSLYPELYQAKLKRVRRTIDRIVAEHRERVELKDFEA
ncbi:hypothetical protein OAB86_00500 [Gammaproteobacteria bacterium]|nr:hypothetical protein [Gammaproteobacteria bacterium]